MSEELGDLMDELRIIHSFFIFIGFAIVFSLARSLLVFPVGILHAIIPAGIFFIVNAAKYIHDEYM